MKKVALIAAAVLTASAMSVYAGDIGVVDMKHIFSTSSKVEKIKAQLDKQFASDKSKLEKMSGNLQNDMEKYQKNKTVMSQKDLDKLQSSITTEESKFRAAQSAFQQEVFAAQNKALTSFMDQVKSVVKVVAEKEGVDVVMPKNDVLYSKSKLDLTQKVMDKLG